MTKEVFLPDMVSVNAEDLMDLRCRAALLEALLLADVVDWVGYEKAKFLFHNDPSVIDIKLGWKKPEHQCLCQSLTPD